MIRTPIRAKRYNKRTSPPERKTLDFKPQSSDHTVCPENNYVPNTLVSVFSVFPELTGRIEAGDTDSIYISHP